MSPQFSYSDLLPIGADKTKYRNLGKAGVSVIKLGDRDFLQVSPEALTLLTETAIHDISHYLRTEHLQQLANILKDKVDWLVQRSIRLRHKLPSAPLSFSMVLGSA